VSGNKNGRSGRPKYLKLMFEESREKVNLTPFNISNAV
jgi:hypothetical protein